MIQFLCQTSGEIIGGFYDFNKNDYYDVACNSLCYLQTPLWTECYNDMVVHAQQVTEKMLKSVAERVCTDADKLMHTHNLRGIYDAIHKIRPDFNLDRGALSMLKDFYFDAKYPGDNFVVVDRETCEKCLATMYDCIREVHKIREELGLENHSIKEKMLEPTQMNLF